MTAIPTSEIHMVTQVQSISRRFSMEVSVGSVHLHPHLHAVSRPKFGIFELGLDFDSKYILGNIGQHTSDYTRLGLPWGANLTFFTGTKSSGSLETELERALEEFSSFCKTDI